MLPPDEFCLLGQATVQGTVHVCRNGGFVEAFVTNAQTGQPYQDTANPLVFHLRWEQPLISLLQTQSNFVVFYRTAENGATSVFEARCDGTTSSLPCLKNITQESDGAWSVDLVKSENGYMR